MTPENTEKKKDEELTGRDLPNGDGIVSDEDMQAITGENDDRPTGQDHSTDNHERQAPTEGVGAIQSENDTTSDIARIEDSQ
ncbi:MAG: hypothetical protein ACR2F2_08415 [Pyrinomonadaceae bacterium]